MEKGGFFYYAFVYLSAAVVSVPIAKRAGLGSVLGYLLAGIIIGPFCLHFVGGEEGNSVMHFAEFGVVMMLFLIGLELKPMLLWKLRASILGLGGLQVFVTTTIITAIGYYYGLQLKLAVAIGLSLALSSTAIVMQTLKEKSLNHTAGGRNAFAVLLFQDIAVIPILAIIPLLASGEASLDAVGSESGTWIDGLPMVYRAGIVFAAISSIIVAGKYLISPVLRLIAKTGLREMFTAAALLLIISIALLMIYIGLSPALGAFLAGVVLAQSEYRHELETDIEPFKGLLLGLFFIAVGASVDFEIIMDNPLMITQLVLALVVIKFIVLFVIGRFFKMGLDNNLLFAFSLAQGGEFAFVLISFAIQSNVMGSSVANPLVAVVAVSMAFTPLLMLLNEKLIQPRFGTTEKDKREDDSIDEKNKVIIAGFGKMGSIIGRLIQANGVSATYLDLDPDNVDLLRKLGLKVYYGDASRYDLLKAAGADEAEVIIITVSEVAVNTAIVNTVQKNFPKLKIFVRANGFRHNYNLLEYGINNVYRGNFDTALRLGVDVLSELGFRKYNVLRSAKRFRRLEEEGIKRFAKMRTDNVHYMKEVKLHLQDLEKLMLYEQENAQKDKDVGWDAASRRKEFGKK